MAKAKKQRRQRGAGRKPKYDTKLSTGPLKPHERFIWKLFKAIFVPRKKKMSGKGCSRHKKGGCPQGWTVAPNTSKHCYPCAGRVPRAVAWGKKSQKKKPTELRRSSRLASQR